MKEAWFLQYLTKTGRLYLRGPFNTLEEGRQAIKKLRLKSGQYDLGQAEVLAEDEPLHRS